MRALNADYGHNANGWRGQSPKEGGSQFGHNGYGRDYSSYGRNWNLRLCASDSDVDGQTNGLELGDPCCGWGGGVSSTEFSSAISNPGDGTSRTTRSAPLVCTDPSTVCPTYQWMTGFAVSGAGPTADTEGLGVASVSATGDFVVFGVDSDGKTPRTWQLSVDEARLIPRATLR